MHLSTEAMGTATRPGSAQSGLARWLRGIKWTDEEDKGYREMLTALGIARKEFAEVARSEIGAEVADLFAGIERAEATQPAVP
jgi:hypothetical protein